MAEHQVEIYVYPWSQDHNHFCAALSEIHTLLSAYNTLAWNLSENTPNNVLKQNKSAYGNAVTPVITKVQDIQYEFYFNGIHPNV